ncbi:MAG: hypothetical protein ACRYHQ_27875 [Janthinobacterium lividum]
MKAALLAAALLAGAPAFGQGRGIVLQAQPQASPLLPIPSKPRTSQALHEFQPAPLPNRDYEAPAGPRASNSAELAPGVFTRKELYRGEGFSPGSTSAADTDRRAKPGAGFNLRMPLQSQ